MKESNATSRVRGLHLATDETVTDAWELFFSACWDAWEIVQQRRAEKLKQSKEAEQPSLIGHEGVTQTSENA